MSIFVDTNLTECTADSNGRCNSAYYDLTVGGSVYVEKVVIRGVPFGADILEMQISNVTLIHGPIPFAEIPTPIMVGRVMESGCRIRARFQGLEPGSKHQINISIVGSRE